MMRSDTRAVVTVGVTTSYARTLHGQVHYAEAGARTLMLGFTTPEEAHFGEQGWRLSALMPNATTASIPVPYLSALEQQLTEIADAILRFLKDSQ